MAKKKKLKRIEFGVDVSQGPVDDGETEGNVAALSKIPANLYDDVKPYLNLRSGEVRPDKLQVNPAARKTRNKPKMTWVQGLWQALHPVGSRFIRLVYDDDTTKQFTEPRGRFAVED